MKVKPRAARPARRLVHIGPLPHVTVFRPAQYKLSPDAAVWDKKRNQFWKKLCADFSFPNCEEMQRLIRELESEYIEPAAPTPVTLDKLSKSLDTVLDLLQRKENEHEILCALGWRPGLTIDEYESITDKYESLVRGLHVRGLYKISDHLRRRPSSKQKRGAPNKIRDLKDFVARLADIWEGQTGRKATQGWHTKKKANIIASHSLNGRDLPTMLSKTSPAKKNRTTSQVNGSKVSRPLRVASYSSAAP